MRNIDWLNLKGVLYNNEVAIAMANTPQSVLLSCLGVFVTNLISVALVAHSIIFIVSKSISE